MERDIILSICIPTYNRANFLKTSLSSIMSQVTDDLPIEILVSDNCSTDNTQEIIQLYSKNSKFRSFIQNENIGPIKNGLMLIKEHARGDFCWFIGDDDYIINGGIKSVVSILQEHMQIDFMFVKINEFVSDERLTTSKIIKNVNFEIVPKFENLIDPKYSNIFLGELMGGIFKRKCWLGYDKIYEAIDNEYLSTLETAYTHCVIYANQFMGKKAIYISTPIVIADNRAREWWDKSKYITIEHLYTLLKLYKKNGLKGQLLKKCELHYIKITLLIFIKYFLKKNAIYRDKISFNRYILFLLKNPLKTIRASYFVITERINLSIH